jgi:hypothetical protein
MSSPAKQLEFLWFPVVDHTAAGPGCGGDLFLCVSCADFKNNLILTTIMFWHSYIFILLYSYHFLPYPYFKSDRIQSHSMPNSLDLYYDYVWFVLYHYDYHICQILCFNVCILRCLIMYSIYAHVWRYSTIFAYTIYIYHVLGAWHQPRCWRGHVSCWERVGRSQEKNFKLVIKRKTPTWCLLISSTFSLKQDHRWVYLGSIWGRFWVDLGSWLVDWICVWHTINMLVLTFAVNLNS